ncbi:MAG: bifunctional oligoribonuclease/PAP phosphatase NrnA [Anaerolineae bacterium]|nr:bifunctional oligoribonuclease/PAP phosphatase NrnA [Anaerolineae bacterium]
MSGVTAQIAGYLRQAERILLVGHMDPDGDAVGALLGLRETLRRLGKQVVPALPDRPPSKYAFLPGFAELTTAPAGSFDLFVSLDSSDTARLEPIYSTVMAPAGRPVINIDHHITNVMFGTLNWVEPKAASTSEMIISLVDALGVPMGREIALPLLTGIVMDTRGFRTSNTTSDTLRAASRLMDAGASLSEVMERALNSRPYAMLCLWGKMIPTVHLEGRIAWAVLTPAMQAECGNPEEGDGGFINLLVSLQEADVGLLFYDKGDHAVEVGFRAKPGIDISGVAFALGGGGHPQAAGCTVEGSLEEVRARVLDMVRRAIDGQRALYR